MTIKARSRGLLNCAVLFGALMLCASLLSASEVDWWSEVVDSRLADAGTNRVELLNALTEVPIARREGVAFLLENMSTADIKSLSAAFLVEDVGYAFSAEFSVVKDPTTGRLVVAPLPR